MRNIERLFEGKRPVPGMRPSARDNPADTLGAETIIAVPISERIDDPGADSAPEPTAIPAPEPATLSPGPELLYAHEPNGARSERIRVLRTRLSLQQGYAGDANTVAVLGACPGEGRSLLAAELALSFAQFNRPTLLVDVDFRNPRQHRLFGAGGEEGLAQAIASHGTPLYQSVQGYPSLSLLTAGARPDNPLELLMDWRFESLVREWQHSYEFIVLDTPPAGLYSDALAVATVVGRVLLVYRARHTREKDAREMVHRLKSTNAQIVGSALSHF